MIKFLSKLFVRDYEHPEKADVRGRYGIFATIVGIVLNVILFIGKFIVGTLVQSTSIIADAFNNLSDAGSSLISTISIKISLKPADRNHPFGYARMEYIASMIVSFLILTIGIELFKESVTNIANPQNVEFDLTMFIILLCAVLLKLWLFVFYRTIGKKINSSVILASAADSLGDILSTSAVLVSSVIIYFTKFYILDGIVGLCVSVFILYSGFSIFKDTMSELIGQAPSGEDVDAILKIVHEYEGVCGIHDMMIHNYGPSHNIVSFHVEVDGSRDVFESHDMIDNIEMRVRKELQMECTIHMDPIVTNDAELTEIRELALQKMKEIDPRMLIHDFRMVKGETHSNLIFDICAPFELKQTDEELIQLAKEKVKTINPKYFAVVKIDRM